jgi:hypothetical protein
MSRRTRFFLAAALVCAALIPVAENDLRYVPTALAITYVILALASEFDQRSRQHQRR